MSISDQTARHNWNAPAVLCCRTSAGSVIGPEHLGQTLAVFSAIEVKAPKGRLREEQRSFLELVERFGGSSGVATSVEEAARVLRLS